MKTVSELLSIYTSKSGDTCEAPDSYSAYLYYFDGD